MFFHGEKKLYLCILQLTWKAPKIFYETDKFFNDYEKLLEI